MLSINVLCMVHMGLLIRLKFAVKLTNFYLDLVVVRVEKEIIYHTNCYFTLFVSCTAVRILKLWPLSLDYLSPHKSPPVTTMQSYNVLLVWS